jgi:hypothetical protein
MQSGVFTISLDFELHWGGFEKWELNDAKKEYFKNTRALVPSLLLGFQQFEVHVTWATVGLLMHKNKESLLAHVPERKPSYSNELLSAYNFIQNAGIGASEESDPYHFADSLIRLIVDSKYQELASHSFAHYYCNEAGQTTEQFDADCKVICESASAYDSQLKSLVFPRNQFNTNYLKVCKKNGIQIVRSNPVDWWWDTSEGTSKESLWKRLNRGADAYFNIGGKTSYGINAILKQEDVYLLPASRLLRPYNPKELFLNQKKINRIKAEMTIAAQNKEFYHLWWHPHNFGVYPEGNMKGLNQILQHFRRLSDQYGMISLNMGEIAERLQTNTF